jgi:hypothetical protein
MENKQFSDLKMIPSTAMRTQNGESLTFRVWNGTPFLTINGSGRDARPIVNKALKIGDVFLISSYLSDLLKSEPGKENTLVHNAYNRQDKKWFLDYLLVLKKDEHKVNHIVVKSDGQTYDFVLTYSGNTWQLGTGEISPDKKSSLCLSELIYHLRNLIPVQATLTNFPREMNGAPGGNRYNNNKNSYSGQNDFQQSNRRLPSDDDIFSQE